MRSRHLIAIAIILAVGFSLKPLFLSSPAAVAQVDDVKTAGIEVSKVQLDAKLPLQPIHDMSLVFSNGD